ncbi:MAG: enoyl-CoA hydratase-related protein, partial [Gemmatimonadaceae bacterium]
TIHFCAIYFRRPVPQEANFLARLQRRRRTTDAGKSTHKYISMPFKFLTLEVADRVATLTVNRPDKLNALNDATIAELGTAIDQIRVDDAIGGVILTGAGRAFVAGADISELSSQSPVLAKARSRAGQDVFRRFETCPKPVIAAVNGFALGGGCELAMSCHVRIASDAAKFGQPESKLGILPGYGGSQRLARLVGKGRAMQLLMTGEMIDAAEAYRIGLVNKVMPAAQLMSEAQSMMKTILANGPLAVALCIEAIDRGLEMSLEEGLILEANHFGLLAATDDMREGMRAFLEKRAPAFKGK